MTNRRYIITYLGVARTVFPLLKGKKIYSWQREQDQIFKRKKFATSLQFINDTVAGKLDFDFFKDIELSGDSCTEISLKIQRQCSGTWQDEWFGYFSTGGGSFDFDKCMFEVKPEPDDVYRCIFDNWEKKFNMFDYVVWEVEPGISSTFEECISTYQCDCGAGSPACPPFGPSGGCPSTDPADYEMPCIGYATEADMLLEGWCLTTMIVTGGPGTIYGVEKVFRREVAVVPCNSTICATMTAEWILLVSDCGGSGTCTFARCAGTGEPLLPMRGVLWIDTMSKVIESVCSDIENISSIFFDYMPDTNDPHYNQFGAGTNYITQAASKVNYLIVSQKSDIIAPVSSNPATVGEFTLKQWLQWAREVFNVYWDITISPFGVVKFRMEHYDFYQSLLAIDTTLPKYTTDPRAFVKRFNRYEHLKDSIPKLEKFKWADDEQATEDFIGRDIIYNDACSTVGQEVSHTPEQLSTDIAFITGNADLSKEGFCLISTELIAGDYIINSEQGLLTGNYLYNGHLAWSSLHYNYHRYNRFLQNGNMNDINTIFFSWKPNIKQPALQIPSCCEDIDPEGYVLTELGQNILTPNREAFIDKMELDTTDVLTLNLTYSI